MSFRTWLSLFTVVLLAVIVYFSRHEIAHAWGLLGRVNIWLLFLLIPGQMLVYYAAGEMIFSYLRSKKAIGEISGFTLMRMALEMNFVNHILPSAGVSGVSYMNWRFGRYGVSAGRATMAQVVRFSTGFAGFILLLFISVFAITIDGSVNRWIISLSALLVGLMLAAISSAIFLLSSKVRLERFSMWLHVTGNSVISKVTFGRKRSLIDGEKMIEFFVDLHRDYLALSKDKKLLIKPFLWGLLFTSGDALLFMITFWALGTAVNPAIILIAYGLAALAGFFVATPGGAGAYEAIMVSVLTIAGITSQVAIAGILLTRVILLLGTIGFGYLFYQHAILKYGKDKKPPVLS
ncbi:MAG: lysylphosphatidylglycerol synthase transmembrane domain-containing protein [Candidatus Saccharibacteria bacterium]